MMLNLIEIEIYSYCNRKCSFCPNSGDAFRQDRKNFNCLDFELYKKLILDLSANNYSGVLSFSRYNEPLAFKHITKKYVEFARSHLDVKIVSNTNGDYLDRESLEIFDELTVMDYAGKGVEWWSKKITQLGGISTPYDDPEFLLFSTDSGKKVLIFLEFEKNATIEDRGGILNLNIIDLKSKNNWQLRKRPCYEPTKFLGIDYNGNIMPCCNLQSTFHQEYSLGNIYKTDIMSVYRGEKRKKFIDIMTSTNYNNYYDTCKRCQKDPGRYTRENPGIEYKHERK